MSVCGNCGAQQICTCEFIDGSNAVVTGDGRSYAPINYRPTNVPLPRPYGHLSRELSNQTIAASQSNVPIVFDTTKRTPFSGGMINPAQLDRLTVPVAGYYLVYGFLVADTPAGTGNDILSITKNGSIISRQIGALEGPRSLMILEQFAVNDFIQLTLSTPAGGNTVVFRIGLEFHAPQLWAQLMRGI